MMMMMMMMVIIIIIIIIIIIVWQYLEISTAIHTGYLPSNR